MKKTTIQVKGFDCDFQLEVVSKSYMDIKQAKTYVKRKIVETAYVLSVKHDGKNGEKR